MIGYKAFDKDLKCRDFQFEVGKTYSTKAKKQDLELCTNTVFHFCRELHKIENVSDYKILKSRVCEVIATGDIVTDGDKYGTNKIKILREIPREELDKYNSCNSGDCNSGNYNSGNWNSGDCNSGNWNSGNCNSGNWNSGNCNSGNRNSGNCNSGNCNSGFFNSDESCVRMFNKMTKKKRNEINIPSWCYFDLTVWVSHDTATDKEKEEHKKEIETCGGYLKTLEYKEAWRLAWDRASKEEHKELLKLPNWNNKVFKEITGIDAEAEIAKEEQNIELTYERKTNNELKGLLEKLLNPLCSSEDLQRAREYLKNQEIKNVFQFMQRGNELLKE